MDSGTRIFAPFLWLPVSLVTLKAAFRYIDYHVYFCSLLLLLCSVGFLHFSSTAFSQLPPSFLFIHVICMYNIQDDEISSKYCVCRITRALMWADLVNKLSRCSYISTLASFETPGGKAHEVSFITQSWASTLLSTTFTPQSLMNSLLT